MPRIVTIQDNKIQSRGVKKATAGQKIDARYKDTVDEWLKNGKWIGVRSSNVKQIRFEKPAQRMWVRFKNGSEYHYNSVTTATARRFYEAASMGRFVWYLRRNGYVGIKST